MKTKEEKIEDLVDSAVDCMDLGDLIDYFSNAQKEYFESLSDEEVNRLYTENFE